jgi:hypothetical protein
LKATNRCAIAATLVFAAAGAQAAPWTFTKVAAQPVSTATQGAQTLVFQVSSAPGATITRMGFQLTGKLPVGSVTSFELVAYPSGLGAPGIIVGTNDGSTWAPNAAKAVFEIPLTAPFALGASGATFVLRANVKGGSSYFFNTDLRAVAISEAGVERFLLAETQDLPLSGDIFSVN